MSSRVTLESSQIFEETKTTTTTTTTDTFCVAADDADAAGAAADGVSHVADATTVWSLHVNVFQS